MEGRPKDESELFSRAQRGDTAAYEEIVQRYQLVAFRTAYVITGSAADAEEAAQDGFVEEDRLVITSRYLLELSGEETAATLGIPEGTVKSRLSRALARLRATLEEVS